MKAPIDDAELIPSSDPVDGPHDAALRQAQDQVERAEVILSNARDARSRAMVEAYQDGYSIYLLGVMTGRRKPTSVHRDLRRLDVSEKGRP